MMSSDEPGGGERELTFVLHPRWLRLSRVSQQVRPALVDLPEDQLAAPNNDINMDDNDNYGLELDWSV